MNATERAQKVRAARAAADRGDYTTAERLVAEVKLSDSSATKGVTLPRLDFTSAGGDSPAEYATKTWYQARFGELDRGAEQVLRELYGGADYTALMHAKMAGLRQYVKHGERAVSEDVARLLLLSPEQINGAVKHGVSVREIKATMVESQDTLGGFLVPESWNAEMQTRIRGLTVVRQLARQSTTQTDRLKLPVRTGGDGRYIGNVRVSMVDESPTADQAATNATFGEVAIPVHTAMAHATISKSLLEDSGVSIIDELSEEFSTAAAIVEDEQFLVGSGVGQPQGILNGTAANGAPLNADIVTVNSGGASTLTADGIVAVPWRLAGQYRQMPTCAWVMGKATGEAISKMKDGIGRYLWSEMNGTIAEAVPGTLRGFKYRESDAMPAVAANTYPLIFGDFQGYRIVDRIGMSISRYDDFTTARTNVVGLVMRRRYGGQVTQGYRFVVLKVAS